MRGTYATPSAEPNKVQCADSRRGGAPPSAAGEGRLAPSTSGYPVASRVVLASHAHLGVVVVESRSRLAARCVSSYQMVCLSNLTYLRAYQLLDVSVALPQSRCHEAEADELGLNPLVLNLKPLETKTTKYYLLPTYCLLTTH